MAVTVSQLNVFPVKGLRGIAVDCALATQRGLANDRRFMVVDRRGDFLSQREIPRMATVRTEIAGNELRLAVPGREPIAVALEPAAGEGLQVTVWENTCHAIAPSAEADRWLSSVLGHACRLVYMPETTRRQSDARHAGSGRLVGFADGYAFLVVSEASLAALNERLLRPVPMDRFRPNIVVTGTLPFAEDAWRDFAAGDAVLRMAKPCGRCAVTATDQATGEVDGPEPLRTLANWRGSKEHGARFGMNAVTQKTGRIRVGDPIAPARASGPGELGGNLLA